MTTTGVPSATPAAVTGLPELAQARKTHPITVWAILGVVFLAIEGYALAAWFISGDAHRTPAGTTPIPEWMKVDRVRGFPHLFRDQAIAPRASPDPRQLILPGLLDVVLARYLD
jgi:hypothetical protein